VKDVQDDFVKNKPETVEEEYEYEYYDDEEEAEEKTA